MKLLDRYNRLSVLVTILVIAVAGVVYYFSISYILTGQVDKDLEVEENEIFQYVKLNNQLPHVFKSDHLKIYFNFSNDKNIKRRFANTQLYDPDDGGMEAARMLTSSVSVGQRVYRIQIVESKVETEDLIRLIFVITLSLVLVLLTGLLLLNRILVRKLWQPFYQTLQQIKRFNVADSNAIRPLDTRIEEFHDLNEEITAMSQRVLHDYQSLKDFVENASHELMTPLAVILSKLDTLAQDSDITSRQGTLIGEVYDTLGKLKKLNRAMLLLARLENKLMPEAETIELSDFINDKIAEFQDLLANRQITLSAHLVPFQLHINRDLLHVLFNNLLGNAIAHNRPGGTISIQLEEGQLAFCNTGVSAALDAGTIFQRFHKSPESEGSGLGLTLIKQICETYGYRLSYEFRDGTHCFALLISEFIQNV